MSSRVAALPRHLLELSNALEGDALALQGAGRRLGSGRAAPYSSSAFVLAEHARRLSGSVATVARRLGAADAPGGVSLARPTVPTDDARLATGYPWPQQLHGGLASDGDSVNDVLRTAASQVGVRESATNRQDYGAWFGANGVFWCAEFVSWTFAQSGHPLPNNIGGKKGASGYAYCQFGRDEAYKRGELFSRPRPGDVFFHFVRGDHGPGHTGIVIDVLADGRVVTIEGNASPNSGRDGGGVVKQTRTLKYTRGLTFWRVLPPAEDDDRTAEDLALRPSNLRARSRRRRTR